MQFSTRNLFIGLFLVASCTTHWQRQRAQPTAVSTPPGDYSGSAFDEPIRTTEARTPEEERQGFSLPPGFEISLFASEPQIGKPINMAFDARGRLWVTQSVEYPFAAKPGQGRDRLTILEDKDHDGRADSFTTVRDTLNIPIGILPVPDGAVHFSIPNVYKLTDADGDDKPEKSTVLLGPFGYKDTHGMVNHLTRGFDGWIHSCHGYTNLSKITGTDGDTVVLGSGNTFRFREDGSRVEQTTRGRVNPFGMVFDDWGYLYSSDCHSSPLYQLIRGAEYPYFGRLPQGVGFAPIMKPHEQEATALAGLAISRGTTFPEPYRNSFFVGDVVKCRIYRSSYIFKGASPVAKMEDDFLRSTDPWFRPTDIVQGPDGALYVADFYNRIIGHYEVPLTNPGRDHLRGRIWRITYKGQTNPDGHRDWTKADLKTLLAALTETHILSVRMTAADQLVHRLGKQAVEPLTRLAADRKGSATQQAHALWILHQLNALPQDALLRAVQHPNELVRTHALRIVQEMKTPGPTFYQPTLRALADASPHVQRAAVEALENYPTLETIQALVAFEPRIPAEDTHLMYTTKLCLRNLLRRPALGQTVATTAWNRADLIALAEPMSGVDTAYAARHLLRTLKTVELPKETELKLFRHAALYLPSTDRDELVTFIQKKYTSDASSQYRLYTVVQQSIKQRSGVMNELVRNWGVSLAERLIDAPAISWPYQLEGDLYLKAGPVVLRNPPPTTPLARDLNLIGFELGGFRGIVRSPVFAAPSSLTFSVINANARKSTDPLNRVQLRLADETAQIVARQEFPKVDDYGAANVTWDLASVQGKPVYLELVDQSAGFIWVGGFSSPAVQMPALSPKEEAEQQRFAILTAGESGITRLEPAIRKLFQDPATEYFIKTACAKSLLLLNPNQTAPLLGSMLNQEQYPLTYRKDLATVLGEAPLSQTRKVLEAGLKTTTGDIQLELLKALAASSEGKDLILKQVRNGTLYTRVLVQPGLEDRMRLNSTAKQEAEFQQLTANLSPIDETREALIQQRLAQFATLPRPVEGGRTVFVQNCSPCHQINKDGGMIGPQLDGIGSWGSKALATKILDPNRNISEAFRTYSIKLKSGIVKTGLYRREEAGSMVFANAAGEEFFVPKKDIAESQASKFTLMPDHFGQVIPPDEFNKLLSYLLSVK